MQSIKPSRRSWQLFKRALSSHGRIGQFNGHDLMVVKVEGPRSSGTSMDDTDDFFLVLAEGKLHHPDARRATSRLARAKCSSFPKGMEHCPVAEEEAHILLIEPTGHAGHTGNPQTCCGFRTVA